jgi:hypothetical protein
MNRFQTLLFAFNFSLRHYIKANFSLQGELLSVTKAGAYTRSQFSST